MAGINLLAKIGLRRIDSELDWLKQLRDYSEEWYNELVTPILPVLVDKGLHKDQTELHKYEKCAEQLLNQAYISNSGEKIENIFEEMGTRGITIKSRTKLTPLIDTYIKSGMFLKQIAYNFDPELATSGWKDFEIKKNRLVKEINQQLKKIG